MQNHAGSPCHGVLHGTLRHVDMLCLLSTDLPIDVNCKKHACQEASARYVGINLCVVEYLNNGPTVLGIMDCYMV